MKKVLIVAGGTGGHVFPGIAVAQALREQGVDVAWLGTMQGLDAKLVPQENIEFYQIPMLGLRGKGMVRKLMMPLVLAKAILKSLYLLKKIKPDVVLGFGGYVTAPAGIAAKLLKIKLVIHEQNAVAGMANRYLAKIANVVLQAFPDTFKKIVSAQTVGNPVRRAILNLPISTQRLLKPQQKLHVLVIGGSLGARAINETIPSVLKTLQHKIEIYHQAGKTTYAETLSAYQQCGLTANVVEFIDDMPNAYQWADIIICRAGALTVSELAAVGIASILIPLPSAVDDHQTANAKYLTDNQAGILLPQSQLTAEKLIALLEEFYQNRDKLFTMANQARQLAMVDAVQRVVEYVLQ